jgi:3-methyladenine DNA glycosylase AlkD
MKTFMQIKDALRDSISIPAYKASAFFKTGTGQYAAHDQFIGVTVPNLRRIAKKFMTLSLNDQQRLLQSKINEERFLALIILTDQYKSASDPLKETLYKFYINNVNYVNNWNLVDASAHLIVGAHLFDKDRHSLLDLAQSDVLWHRRIAIVSTWYFIRRHDLEWTFTLASRLQKDSQDLIHKAVGWMLREAGKRSNTELVKFLDHHASTMPRTMLRYAIEKFPEEQRKNYLYLSNLKRSI